MVVELDGLNFNKEIQKIKLIMRSCHIKIRLIENTSHRNQSHRAYKMYRCQELIYIFPEMIRNSQEKIGLLVRDRWVDVS